MNKLSLTPIHFYSFVLLLLLTAACSSTKKIVEAAPVEEPEVVYEEEFLDTLTVSAPRLDSPVSYELPKDNPSAKREMDILHTDLNLSFDWEKQHVLGVAKIKVKPHFYDSDMLYLDAKGFDIHSIKLGAQELKYEYADSKLAIELGKKYTRNESFEITIDYTAKPNEGGEGGSAAITSDKGLFFINPLNEEVDKPQQIWTQGETENNSRWFPTIDKPNERCTASIRLTVQDRFKTLSNGLLQSSTKNNDGTRTDHWVMDMEHAPYLFMLAIGEFSVTQDRWRNIDVDYYVEPSYESSARKIFNHTPEMLDFFSDKLDYVYPWQKYSQVVVRDYVSGAMENTTAVIFGDQVQKTNRELIDNDNDYIVAHEMIHHWFGDLVTCESWSNLTLNEGFANYGEYIWFEYKYGKNRAELHRKNEQEGYMAQTQYQGAHPLIHYSYDKREDMFDAHSYNKGGLVLHMLRNYLGDEAFYASLNYYLERNKNSAVEVDDLRLAFEKVSGEDLRFFFDQWYLSSGHPVLELSHSYDTLENQLVINISQTQNPALSSPVFQFPLSIDIYDESGVTDQIETWIDERSEEIRIPASQDAFLVHIDPEYTILSERVETFSKAQNALLLKENGNIRSQLQAIGALAGDEQYAALLESEIDDEFYAIREVAVSSLSIADTSQGLIEKLKSLAKKDPHSAVRKAALLKLSDLNLDLSSLAKEVLQTEQAFPVLGGALQLLYKSAPDQALGVVNSFNEEEEKALVTEIGELYALSGDTTYLQFFRSGITTVSDMNIFDFHGGYFNLLKDLSPPGWDEDLKLLQEVGLSKTLSIYKKFAATNTLNSLYAYKSETDETFDGSPAAFDLINKIRLIIDAEQNPTLRKQYGLD